jgi:hypothetical protein
MNDQNKNELALRNSWNEFCDSLKEAGSIIEGEELNDSFLDSAEGYRYLTRLLRVGLEMSLERGDKHFPEFYALCHDTAKFGGDNPDNLYQNATIDGSLNYRIWGHKGTVHYLSFVTNENRYAEGGTMTITGELYPKDMLFDNDGNFEIFLSHKPKQRNWLPMELGTNFVVVRQTFLDKLTEIPASFNIECLDGIDKPLNLSIPHIEQGLKKAVNFVKGTSNTFNNWTKIFKEQPNQFSSIEQSMFLNAGGDPNIHYLYGNWELDEDQGLVIRTKIPTCEYWNFHLNNHWLESLDYRYFDTCINNASANLESDGSLTVLVSAKNAGAKNWLDVAHHKSGTMTLRWVNSNTFPFPDTEVINLKDF